MAFGGGRTHRVHPGNGAGTGGNWLTGPAHGGPKTGRAARCQGLSALGSSRNRAQSPPYTCFPNVAIFQRSEDEGDEVRRCWMKDTHGESSPAVRAGHWGAFMILSSASHWGAFCVSVFRRRLLSGASPSIFTFTEANVCLAADLSFVAPVSRSPFGWKFGLHFVLAEVSSSFSMDLENLFVFWLECSSPDSGWLEALWLH